MTPNEIEFTYGDEVHTYEPKPITMNLLMLVQDIGDDESKAAGTALDILFLRKIDGVAAHKAPLSLRIVAALLCLDFLATTLANSAFAGNGSKPT